MPQTPINLHLLPSKDALLQEFQGKHLETLRTPAFVIDRSIFAKNCARMHSTVIKWGIDFRAHLKSHKTIEGTKLQLSSSSGSTHAVVVSTLMEAWHVLQSGLVSDGIVSDLLYGMPVAVNKFVDLSLLWEGFVSTSSKAVVRILVDHWDQIDALENFESQRENSRRWSVFVKVDAGYKRSGMSPLDEGFKQLIAKILASPYASLHGFYCHAGDSYASNTFSQAESFLNSEIEVVNSAAKIATCLITDLTNKSAYSSPLVLSVGSTPTAHAATEISIKNLKASMHGRLELHAGNYPLLDLQQLSTGLTERTRISHRVLSTVVSLYPGRGAGNVDEALCDAGAIAMSKDTGPSGGFGDVIGKRWRLSKVSQEHGILTKDSSVVHPDSDPLKIGEQVRIVGQHACLIAAAFPWYYIVDSSDGVGDVVVDVWVPWKGW